jgi:hypothetical protein
MESAALPPLRIAHSSSARPFTRYCAVNVTVSVVFALIAVVGCTIT